MGKYIDIKHASDNNLKDLSVKIPRDSLSVITGVSGSGKSSLAYDTLFREGQRKYIESLSSYARQFIGQIKKPAVEHISGISPTISVDQKTINRNPRSTVGTVTGVYDLLRLLFARLGTPHCPGCGDEIHAQTTDQIARSLEHNYQGNRIIIMAPIVQDRKGEYRKECTDLIDKGFIRARVDGEIIRLDENFPSLKRYEKHTIEAVVDRIRIEQKNIPRLREAIETAVNLSGSLVSIINDLGKSRGKDNGYMVQSTQFACPKCSISLPEIEPRLFSFNNVQGACPSCQGLGYKQEFDADLIVPDKNISVEDGCIKSITENGNVMFSQYGIQELRILAKQYKFDLSVPWKDLPARARKIVLFGSSETLKFKLTRHRTWKSTVRSENRRIRGVIDVMYRIWNRWHIPMMEKYMRRSVCSACNGMRLSPQSLAVLFRNRNIVHYSSLSISAAGEFFQNIETDASEFVIGKEIFKELSHRLKFLNEVGLGYITLDRSTASLSGGEAQRIRLASQVGSSLQGVLYILDEPTIGLHSRDNTRLLQTLYYLKNIGNTLVVVEHDEDTMKSADSIFDMGPGAGELGGRLIAKGTYSEIKKNRQSLTGAFLSGRQKILIPPKRSLKGRKKIEIKGASENNLKKINISFPLGTFICVTGVSGSGKSTLVDYILKRAVSAELYKNRREPGRHKRIQGIEHINKLVEINQSPIGRTPRSNPVTYTKVFDHIRDLFAGLPESKIRGYKKGRFSFNVKGGRCETCGGAGVKIIEMQLLADVEIPCEECSGKRFNDATLEVYFNGRNIYDVLDMTIESAYKFFRNQPRIRRGLEMLKTIGLGYVRLGQSSTTLSGGEAQRIKLAAELQKPGTGNTLYLLDEPTTGLHFNDISDLLNALQSLVDRGNTLIVVEHNLDVIKTADYIIDLGPEGGELGGSLVASGAPEEVALVKHSYTGAALNKVFNPSPRTGKISGVPKQKRGGRKSKDIIITGASKHNLKNINVKIPWNKFTVVTGVSGSGKSTLAFGTLFAEGQRRFIESLSTYARRFVGRLDKGDVEHIEGLAPAIAIDQKHSGKGSKSTAATITEVYDYFRLLYAKLGTFHCPQCGKVMEKFTLSEMVSVLLKDFMGKPVIISAPLYDMEISNGLFLDRPESLQFAAGQLFDDGFERILVDNVQYERSKTQTLRKASTVYLFIDRIDIKKSSRGRVSESLETALEKGHGIVKISNGHRQTRYFSTLLHCKDAHSFIRDEVLPRNFSFNSHWGACTKCAGRGRIQGADLNKLIPDYSRKLLGTAIKGLVGRRINRKGGYYQTLLKNMLASRGYNDKVSFGQLSAFHKHEFLYGIPEALNIVRRRRRSVSEYSARWKGLLVLAETWYDKEYNEKWDKEKEDFVTQTACPDCAGTRLKAPFCNVTVNRKNIGELTAMTSSEAFRFIKNIKFTSGRKMVGERILKEISGRLSFLNSVGLEYLGLNREAGSLSGGEMQRIRLASQIGSGLEGVLYVLDEPTVGLHQQDTKKLITTLKKLRDSGNTVVTVEHDPEVINQADWIIDIGPKAGDLGGEITAAGTPDQIRRSKNSLTGKYLSGKKSIQRSPGNFVSSGKYLKISGAYANNLKDVDLEIPMGCLAVCCGVSGSGKSSLIMDVLVESVKIGLTNKKSGPVFCRNISLPKQIDQMLIVDQSPLGRSPRSCPVTYGNVFDKIRDLYASIPSAKVKGFSKARFSLNVGKGRCSACEGYGKIKKEMHFLSDVWIPCDACNGKRYNTETLDIEYKGKNISDILEMTVDEACDFFSAHSSISRYIKVLQEIGLGYIQLGRPSNTLSGGEAQRIKLAAELAKGTRKNNLYILDEPTTGMHLADIHQLLLILRSLVKKGHSVIIIEHQLDVIASADWLFELGPEGGHKGGRLIFQGPPGKLIKHPVTPTGRSLKQLH